MIHWNGSAGLYAEGKGTELKLNRIAPPVAYSLRLQAHLSRPNCQPIQAWCGYIQALPMAGATDAEVQSSREGIKKHKLGEKKNNLKTLIQPQSPNFFIGQQFPYGDLP